MKREQRYFVFKIKDMSGMTREEIDMIEYLAARQEQLRKYRGAKPLGCVVVENNWPEYEQVWELIAKRVDNESKIT